MNIAAIYARSSGHEYASVKNQIKYLQQYAIANNYKIYNTYFDFQTGTTLNREGLQNLFKDMFEKKFDTIIVKDLSRFSRNYLEAGKYIEEIFPSLNIKLIAVNDNNNTIVEDDSVVFTNYLSTLYSKDIQKKIRNSLIRIGTTRDIIKTPKYGYYNDSGKLEIDEFSGLIIKRIYDEAEKGISIASIAKKLSLERVLIPSVYKHKMLGYKTKAVKDIYNWSNNTVYKILTDIEYCGNAINFVKQNNKSGFKNNVIIKNSHPEIITEEQFNNVAGLLKKRRKNSLHNNHLPRLIYCANCKHSLRYVEQKKRAVYYCSYCKLTYRCYDEIIYKAVIKKIKAIMEYRFKSLLKKYNFVDYKTLFEMKTNGIVINQDALNIVKFGKNEIKDKFLNYIDNLIFDFNNLEIIKKVIKKIIYNLEEPFKIVLYF